MLKLVYNNRTILNSARTGYVGFTPAEPAPSIYEYVNLGSTEYVQSSRGDTSIQLTGMPDTSTHNYVTFIFDASYVNTGGSADLFFISSNKILWRSRVHYKLNGVGFVGITEGVTGWTTQSGQTIKSSSVDNVSYRISSLWGFNSYVRLKFAFDRTNYRCYFYVNNTLLGYATNAYDMLTCRKLHISREVNYGSYPKVKNIKVAGFDTLEAAQAWT